MVCWSPWSQGVRWLGALLAATPTPRASYLRTQGQFIIFETLSDAGHVREQMSKLAVNGSP